MTKTFKISAAQRVNLKDEFLGNLLGSVGLSAQPGPRSSRLVEGSPEQLRELAGLVFMHRGKSAGRRRSILSGVLKSINSVL
jgi:hypothetical protein